MLSEIGNMDRALGEIDRRMANIVRLGTVAAVRYDQARLRVKFGDALTGWIPWLTRRAGGDRDWWAPEVGEQVVVLAPDGELAGGLVLGALYQQTHPAPGDTETAARIRFADGAAFDYDREAHRLVIDLPAGAVVELTAAGGVTITGDVQIAGDLAVAGGVAAAGSIAAGGDISDASDSLAAQRATFAVHRHIDSENGWTGTPQ